jgi:hypothetical protein
MFSFALYGSLPKSQQATKNEDARHGMGEHNGLKLIAKNALSAGNFWSNVNYERIHQSR